jgi:hypothetical protein
MAKKAKEEEIVSLEDVVFTNSVTISAIINTLEKKGIITSEEIIDSIYELEDEEVEDIILEKKSPAVKAKSAPKAKTAAKKAPVAKMEAKAKKAAQKKVVKAKPASKAKK